MVEVFKTDIPNQKMANKIIKMLNEKWKNYEINFDLEDCDRILRIESKNTEIEILEIIKLLDKFNLKITILKE